jgi:hypothetical protein
MQSKEGSMDADKDLEQLLQELAAAKAELAAAQAEAEKGADADSAARPKRTAKKAAAKPKPKKRPVHRSELRSECSGTGERFTGADKVRIDMTPVVTKFADPMTRPNDYKYAGVECLLVFDVKQGLMDSDSWKRCKCLDCVKLRKIGQ